MRRPAATAGVAVVVVCGGVAAVAAQSALQAADALESARSGLSRAQDAATSTDESLAALHRASGDIDEAQAALDRWPVDVVAAVPVIGRSFDVERAVTRTADEVVTAALVLGERLPAVRATAGGIDLSALSAVRADLAGPVGRAEQALADLRSTSTALTPAPVGEARSDAIDALTPAVDMLRTAEQGVELVSGLLGASGPRSLLVMLQNNAELRGAGGYSSSFATGRLEDGTVTLDPLRDVLAVADPPESARRVPAPEEYARDFGPLSGNTTMWRSWNMSPHVPDSALVGARVAAELLGATPDVVVLLDVPAMSALASLGGAGVALPDGTTVSPEELADALLVDAYAEAGVDRDAQEQRRAALQSAATTAVSRLLTGDVAATEAAQTVARLADERHLSVWSARPQEQALLVDLGAAGALEPPTGGDLSHVSVNNLGSNKLDLYVDRAVSVDVTVHEDHAEVVQRVRFDNRAPADLVPYVAGYERPGVVVSRVELSAPSAARSVSATLDGAPWPGTVRTGPTRTRAAARLELPRGASADLELRYVLPLQDGVYDLTVVPQALAEDASLAVAVRPADGERLGEVAGADRHGELAEVRGPLTGEHTVQVALFEEQPSRWERFRQWWNSPVEVG